MKKALIGLLVLGGAIIAIAALMRLRSGSDDDLQIFVDDVPTKASSDRR